MDEFQKYFSQTTFHHHFRPKMLKFHPYSILTGDTKVEFVIYSVLSSKKKRLHWKNNLQCFIRSLISHSLITPHTPRSSDVSMRLSVSRLLQPNLGFRTFQVENLLKQDGKKLLALQRRTEPRPPSPALSPLCIAILYIRCTARCILKLATYLFWFSALVLNMLSTTL